MLRNFAYWILFILFHDFCKRAQHPLFAQWRCCAIVFVAFSVFGVRFWCVHKICVSQCVHPWWSFILFNLRYSSVHSKRMWCLWNRHLWAGREIKHHIHNCFHSTFVQIYSILRKPKHQHWRICIGFYTSNQNFSIHCIPSWCDEVSMHNGQCIISWSYFLAKWSYILDVIVISGQHLFWFQHKIVSVC